MRSASFVADEVDVGAVVVLLELGGDVGHPGFLHDLVVRAIEERRHVDHDPARPMGERSRIGGHARHRAAERAELHRHERCGR